jgi:NADPH:quinone reductase-like Zn-dependent oxidoreductase
LTGHGGFDRLDLRDDVPVPLPGPDEVLIRIGAAGVNNTDINTRIGWYSKAVAEATDVGATSGISGAQDDGWSGAAFQFPRIQGADTCGRIVAVGSAVDPSRIGDRVLVEPVFRGSGPYDVRYFGSEVDGGFADYARVPALHAHRIDSDLSDVELASFPCAYSAAENMLTRVGLAAGERVLITGASGGVGSAAMQLAKRRGAYVVAMAGTDKAQAVQALGDLLQQEAVQRLVELSGQIQQVALPVGAYEVALTVTDSAGLTAVQRNSLLVGAGSANSTIAVVAAPLSYVPSAPAAGHNIGSFQ